MKVIAHFTTITDHKIRVMKNCFRVGLYKQGLLHDLSKYSPTEFLLGCKYYQGDRSPNAREREIVGYSLAWLHHKGRNKHHFEYWIDVDPLSRKPAAGLRMPIAYVVEMFIDRIAACQTYEKEAYTDKSPLAYYRRSSDFHLFHRETQKLLEHLLVMLSEKGEAKTFYYIKHYLLKNQNKPSLLRELLRKV